MSRSISTALVSAVVAIFVLSFTVLFLGACTSEENTFPVEEKTGLEKLKEGREAFQAEMDKEKSDLKAYVKERCEQRKWLLAEGIECEQAAVRVMEEIDKMFLQAQSPAVPVEVETEPVEVTPAPQPIQPVPVEVTPAPQPVQPAPQPEPV